MYLSVETTADWTSFVAPFNKYLWISILLWAIISSFVIFMVKKLNKTPGNFSSAIFDVLTAFCNQGMHF